MNVLSREYPNLIGTGVYHLGEAAKYAHVPVATLRSWFKPRSDGQGAGPIFDSEYDPIDGDFAIGFLNLIEVHVARFFSEEGVKSAIIRKAHLVLQQELDTLFPFAHADLGTNGVRIIHETEDKDLIDVISKQHFFEQMKLVRLVYSERTQLAEEWRIARGVSINPRVNFGKPVVRNSGVSTLVVARQYFANHKNAALVAKLFRLTESGVVRAYQFEKGLGRVAA